MEETTTIIMARKIAITFWSVKKPVVEFNKNNIW